MPRCQDAKIPYIPAIISDIAGAWFEKMPLLDDSRYIPGAILLPIPVGITIDASGVAPDIGVGFAFAISPCTSDFHFGFMGE